MWTHRPFWLAVQIRRGVSIDSIALRHMRETAIWRVRMSMWLCVTTSEPWKDSAHRWLYGQNTPNFRGCFRYMLFTLYSCPEQPHVNDWRPRTWFPAENAPQIFNHMSHVICPVIQREITAQFVCASKLVRGANIERITCNVLRCTL